MPQIHVCLITYALDVTPLVTGMDGPGITWHIFTHSNRAEVLASLGKLYGATGDKPSTRRIRLHDYRQNRGLSVSWNDFLIDAQRLYADAMILLNDDVTGSYEDLRKLAHGCINHPEHGVIVCEGYDLMWNEYRNLSFAVVGINRSTLEVVGYFDENCVPYGFEDCDYSRRCALAGVKFHLVQNTQFSHVGSVSQTVPALKAQNQITFRATQDYYVRKWHGLPGHEQYSIPFNDTHFSLRIDAHVRHAPYEGRNRTDIHELVKL